MNRKSARFSTALIPSGAWRIGIVSRIAISLLRSCAFRRVMALPFRASTPQCDCCCLLAALAHRQHIAAHEYTMESATAQLPQCSARDWVIARLPEVALRHSRANPSPLEMQYTASHLRARPTRLWDDSAGSCDYPGHKGGESR